MIYRFPSTQGCMITLFFSVLNSSYATITGFLKEALKSDVVIVCAFFFSFF